MAGSVKVRARLEFPYRSKAQAETIARSLRVDDESYITTTVDGRTLVAEAEADSFLSLLHTLDDYLACVSVAEKVLRGG
ncbi:MAG TPA: KEOPS complex subunit Pcc1 [Thermoplasmata archaeon]|nr:KEOPS complex subunit Pcc1 [Thermoplasmata archaeon]